MVHNSMLTVCSRKHFATSTATHVQHYTENSTAQCNTENTPRHQSSVTVSVSVRIDFRPNVLDAVTHFVRGNNVTYCTADQPRNIPLNTMKVNIYKLGLLCVF